MGTWNTSLESNDTFNEIYHYFFIFYNTGQKPLIISKQIVEEFGHMFNDDEDRHNALFALALAQWETKSLDTEIFKQVKQIIETGNDIKLWKGLDADEETLKSRKIVLDEFLNQISVEKEKSKRRVKIKYEFTLIKIIDIIAPDNKKTFTADEEYRNGEYIQTSSMVNWNSGGGAVFYFTGQGMYVTAKWIDSQTLEITHDKNIVFTKKRDAFCKYEDQGKVIYVAI